MAHLLTCSIKMAQLWIDSHTLCCVCACVNVSLCVAER